MIVYLGSNELQKAYIWSQEIKQIRVGDKKVFPKWREPDSNTLLYLPFTDDLVDHSGRSQSVTKSGTVNITTLNNIKCAYFNWGYLDTQITTLQNLTHTLSARAYSTRTNDWGGIINSNPCGIYQWEHLGFNSKATYIAYTWSSGASGQISTSSALSYNARHCITFSWGRFYVDWVLIGSTSTTPYGPSYKYSICNHAQNSSCSRRVIYLYLREVIIDGKVWDDAFCKDYYQYTKSMFGIS